ncbi:MAG: DUF3467 domain-containing protein [Actinomycetota bacterium]
MTDDRPTFTLRVPDDRETGVYSNFLSVWHTIHEFTLDYAVSLPVIESPVPTLLVSRIKIPPTVVFDMIRMMNDNLNRYEARFGPIRTPGDTDPLRFPDDFLKGDPE